MQGRGKMSSSERQELIINELKQSKEPITASVFAEKANVSRQVIVQDVSILKAKNEPVVATSQGYIYLGNVADGDMVRKTIAVNHTPEQTLEELYIIVDHGVTVTDVSVDHPVYGDITASIRVSNRKEVDLFTRICRGRTLCIYLRSRKGYICTRSRRIRWRKLMRFVES